MVDYEKQELWKERIEGFQASGLSQNAWCREQGLSAPQLRYWLKKLQDAAEEVTAVPRQWIPLETKTTDEPKISVCIGDVVINIDKGFDEGLLADVVRVLVSAC